MSSSTIASADISTSPPTRRTSAFGSTSTVSLSSVCLARSSCTMPMSALRTMTTPNSASAGCPNTRITASIAVMMALNLVKMFPPRMLATERDSRRVSTLTRPSATRSATSSAVSGAACIGIAGVVTDTVYHTVGSWIASYGDRCIAVNWWTVLANPVRVAGSRYPPDGTSSFAPCHPSTFHVAPNGRVSSIHESSNGHGMT